MKIIITIIALLTLSITTVGQDFFQVYSEVKLTELNRKLEVGRLIPKNYDRIRDEKGNMFIKSSVHVNDSLPSNILVRISDLNGDIIKEIDTKYNRDDLDFGFSTSYINNRKFIIMARRGAYYIINLSTNILIGPIQLTSRIECGQDGQSGLIWTPEVFNDGQYLIISAIDEGIYCFNLDDIYNPFEVEFYTNRKILFKGNFFFLDQRKENVYNGIVASKESNYSKEYKSKFLFQGYRFKVDSNNKIIKHNIDNRYLVLLRDQEQKNFEYFIIDYFDGRILNDVLDKEKIVELVNKIEK